MERSNSDSLKIQRFCTGLFHLYAGRVRLPNTMAGLDAFLREIAAFPNGKHDDQVDSTSQALGWLKTPMRGFGVYEFYRRQYMKLMDSQGGLVRLLAPPGPTHVCTIKGRDVMVSNDRTIELSEEEARPLLAAGYTRVDFE